MIDLSNDFALWKAFLKATEDTFALQHGKHMRQEAFIKKYKLIKAFVILQSKCGERFEWQGNWAGTPDDKGTRKREDLILEDSESQFRTGHKDALTKSKGVSNGLGNGGS